MDPWIILKSGDILGGVLAVYTNVLGGWFYGIMLLSLVGMVYLKTQNMATATLVMVITGVAMTASGVFVDSSIVVPSAITFMLVLATAVILHRLWTRS
jgi:hypothetical protein